jgi:hypothetical protein
MLLFLANHVQNDPYMKSSDSSYVLFEQVKHFDIIKDLNS